MAAEAKPRELRVPWPQLDRELARSKVMVATGTQPVIQGDYVGLQGEELRIRTKNGEVGVARSAIRDLRRIEPGRARGRIIGTVAGVVGGLALGAFLSYTFVDDDSGQAAEAISIWLGTAAGTGVLGYFIGKEFDKQTTRIVILP